VGLFGRRTYEDLLASWNAKGGSYKDVLNNTPKKYLTSSYAETSLDWPNSTLLHGDVPAAVRYEESHRDLSHRRRHGGGGYAPA
jgi:dihydrofolate reductase